MGAAKGEAKEGFAQCVDGVLKGEMHVAVGVVAKPAGNSQIPGGDNQVGLFVFRRGLSKDLGFGDEDRSENLRRAAEIARLLNDQGFTVILAMVAPAPAARARARELVGAERWEERAMGMCQG